MFRMACRIALGLALLLPAAAFAEAGYVHDLTGRAFVLASANSAPRSLKVGDIIDSGNVIRTEAASSAVIKFEDGQVMVLRESTGFQVTDYAYNKQRIAQSRAVFRLLAGGMRFITGVIGATEKSAFRLNVGATVTIGIRGSDGDTAIDPVTQAVTAAVNDGALVMETRFGQRLVQANTFAVASLTQTTLALPLSQAPPAVRNAVGRSLSQSNVPINTPVVVRAAATAAAAQAQSRQADNQATNAKANADRAAAAAAAAIAAKQANAQALVAQAEAALAASQAASRAATLAEQRARETLTTAIELAQQAYAQAIANGALQPAPPASSTIDPNKLPAPGAGPPADPTLPPNPSAGTTSTPSGGASGGGGGTASPN